MKHIVYLIALSVLIVPAVFGGGPVCAPSPPLDPALISMKEQGVWYFLCEAPTYCERIPAHYLTMGPPPPCGPNPPQGFMMKGRRETSPAGYGPSVGSSR